MNLLKKDQQQRLGSQNIKYIFEHAWFKSIDFEAIYQKKIKPPYVPRKSLLADEYEK